MGERVKSEKRRHPRQSGETLVRFEGEHFSIYSRALDLSQSGAFLATHYLLDPGTEIRLFILEPSGAETPRDATVVRSISQSSERGELRIGLGIEFGADA